MKKLIYALVFFIIVHCTLTIHNCQAQWVQMSNGMGTSQIVYSFTTNGNYIFAGTDGSGVYLSTNNGTTWTQTTLNNQYVYSFAILGSNIFAGDDGEGVYLSTNNGTTWTQTALNNKAVHSLAVLGNNIFAGTWYGYGVYLSINNGTSWTQTALNNKSVPSLDVLGNNIFAGTSGDGVYLSTNNGTTWTQTTLNNQYVYSFATLGNNIFAGTFSSGVYLSTNNGSSWTPIGLNYEVIASLAVLGNNIFAGTWNGVYFSTDNGTSWIQKNQGFNPIPWVNALLITNDYIFAGTDGESVWRRPLSDFIGIKNISSEIPSEFSLSQNYPNPFNPTTNIRFDLPKNGFVKLILFDALGREVATLVNEKLTPGTYDVNWNGSSYTSGVYYYKLIAGDFVETRKMILIK